jgi:penicillin-binding protein 1C
VGVWVGNFSGEPMHDVRRLGRGAGVARGHGLSCTKETRRGGRGAPRASSRQPIEYAGGIEPAREEWFLAGTEVAQIVSVDTAPGRPRIVSPANGAVLAIDPDIPPARQRVR